MENSYVNGFSTRTCANFIVLQQRDCVILTHLKRPLELCVLLLPLLYDCGRYKYT